MLQRMFVICFLFFSFSARADQLIIEPDMGREPVINTINDAHYSLDLVMYGFTDEALLQALIKQKSNGKTLKIILEERPYKTENENVRTIQKLNNQHINWHGTSPAFRLTHQKTLIVDDKKAMIMTFNFTHSAFKNDRNFALIIDDPKQVKEIKAVFSADWNQKPIINYSSDLIFSPDNSRKKLLTLINSAKNYINIYAQTMSDYKIVGALANAAREGIKINILTSSKLREKQANYLARAGVNIHQSKQRYIHAKVIIIDDQAAALGSINLTASSLDNNRELSVITYDKNIIKQLNATFEKDWNSADRVTNQPIKNLIPDQRTILRAIKMLERLLSS